MWWTQKKIAVNWYLQKLRTTKQLSNVSIYIYIRVTCFAVNHAPVWSRTLLSTLPKEFPITMSAFKLCICLFFCIVGIASAESANNLRPDFYTSRCPLALQTIKEEVTTALRNEPTIGLVFFTLHFIDCFVQASLIFLNFYALYVRTVHTNMLPYTISF